MNTTITMFEVIFSEFVRKYEIKRYTAYGILSIITLFLLTPWCIAKFRGHNKSLPIFWVSVLCGPIGWIVALIWALKNDTDEANKNSYLTTFVAYIVMPVLTMAVLTEVGNLVINITNKI